MKYLGAEKEHSIVCDFGDKLYGKIKTSVVWGIVWGYWGSFPGAQLTYFNDGGSFLVLTSVLAKRDFFGSMKDARTHG